MSASGRGDDDRRSGPKVSTGNLVSGARQSRRKFSKLSSVGVPILTSVKPPHSHPPSDDPQLDRQCAQARMQIRELCLGDRKLKPGDVLAAVSASASDPVREYIERHKMTIKRDIREWRSCKDPTELKDEDDLLSVTKSRKMASKKSTVGRRKKEVESTACETASGQDDSSSLPLPEQDAVPGPSTSGRNIETVVVKEERVKEELDIEDYGDPSDFLEFQTHEGVEGVRNVGENTGAVLAKPSSSGGAGGPFETIICGGDVQIKQEVFEDERDCFNSGMEVDPTLPWPAPSTTGIAEPLSSVTPTCGPPTNFYHVPSSSGTTSQVHPPPKKMKQRVKSNILRSQQMLKAVPSLSLEKCKICTEVFSSPSDLVEHCILRHSDASSKFLPTAEPSIPEHLKPAETFGMIPPTTSGFSAATPPAFSAATTPGFSAATTPGFSAATTPELNVANPPGQPPQNWIPPYISACDVFDGVFVSLRNIPVENRKATRDKILELVNFLSKEKVNPSTVSFSVEKK